MPADQLPTRPSPGRLTLLSLALTAVLSTATACASSQTTAGGDSALAAGTSAAKPPSAPTTTPTAPTGKETAPVTTLRITVAGQTVTATLNDTPTAQDLARQLPLTITLDDFNNVEKVGKLPRPLTMDGVPAGADPDINDIGYYAPSNELVFYYGNVGYFNGIVRLGRLPAADMQLIQRQAGNFTITIQQG